MGRRLCRREFLKGSAAAAAAVSVSRLKVLAATTNVLERTRSTKRVIVVGAGLAGLSAGYELTKMGHDVTILEEQARAGGRVLTLREPFVDGLYAEAGAARFYETHGYTMKYVKLFGLQLGPFQPEELASVFSIRGKVIRRLPGKPVDLAEYPAELFAGLTAEERRLGLDGMWDKYIDSLVKTLGDPARPDWPPEPLKKCDQMDFSEFLRSQGASETARVVLWGEEDAQRGFSSLWMLREMAIDAAAKSTYKIRGGTDLLPKAFAARLAEKIRYGTPVVRIEHNTRSVRVAFLQTGAKKTMEADYLICTIPFCVLRGMEISPPLSPEKQMAIEELGYDSVTRVFLESRKRLWLEQGFNGFGFSDVLGEVWHPTWDQPGPRGILISYQRASHARRVGAMQEGERIRFTLEEMEKIFPGLREHFEGGTSKCWDEDPRARAAA